MKKSYVVKMKGEGSVSRDVRSEKQMVVKFVKCPEPEL
jgi:hypothetical protein